MLHHFPTKESLIQGVVAQLVAEFATNRAPASAMVVSGPLGELHAELEDLRQRLRERPDVFVALIELAVRSRRDAAIKPMLDRLDDAWRGRLVTLLQRGIAAGTFRADLDPARAATAIMAQLKGVTLHAIAAADVAAIDPLVDALAVQLERALTVADPPPPRPARKRAARPARRRK